MPAPSQSALEFEAHRPLLFGIAYRMLGSVSEAEDMVQEAFLRWRAQEHETVRSPRAWLTTAITRLCIDHLRSARKRREEYVGVWLPEPLLEGPHRTVEPGALAESLSTAFLVLLETLSPGERAVFLLREVFEYEYAEISGILDKSEANCRQMFRRAKEHLSARQRRFEADPTRSEMLVKDFMEVCRAGDTHRLLAMLTADAAIYSDGGGKVAAAPRPIFGREKVARFLAGVSRTRRAAHVETPFAIINSLPGVLVYDRDTLIQSMTFEITDGQFAAVYIVRNPEKLGHLAAAQA